MTSTFYKMEASRCSIWLCIEIWAPHYQGHHDTLKNPSFFTPCASAISLRWVTQRSMFVQWCKKSTMSGESQLDVHALFFIDFVCYFKKLIMGMFSKLLDTLFATLGLLRGSACSLKIRDLELKSFLSYFGAVSHTSVTVIIKQGITKRKERG